MIFKMMKKGAVTKNTTKVMKKIGELTSRIALSVMEIDDILSDNEDEPLRNRQRITL